MTDLPTAAQLPPYLVQRRRRLRAQEARRLTVFGLLLGWIGLLGGLTTWLAVTAVPDSAAIGLTAVGGGLLLFAVLAPELLALPEKMWMGLAQVLGRVVMTVLLTFIYVLWVWPLGIVQTRRRGTHPFHSWQDDAPAEARTGWEPFEPPPTLTSGAERRARRPMMAQLFGVIGFFADRGHWAMVPMLVILLGIGIVLFFVSSTALAPFIYTLF